MFRAVGQSRPAKGGLREESLAVMTRVIRAFNHVTPRVITKKKKKKLNVPLKLEKRKFYKRKIRIFVSSKISTEVSEILRRKKKITEIYNTPGINQDSRLLLIYCCSKRRNTYIDNS